MSYIWRKKAFSCIGILAVALVSIPAAQVDSSESTTKSYGKGISLKKSLTLQEAIKNPEKYRNQKVLLEGKIADVCQKKGCWLVLTDSDRSVRITFDGYSFFVPSNSRGKRVLAEGKLLKETISEELARHYASEQAKKGDLSKIKGPQQVISLEASGVQIFD